MTEIFTPTEFQRLTRDVRNSAISLGPRQARYMVDTYYQIQNYRISTMAQARSMQADEEPHETISFFVNQMNVLELQLKSFLDYWSSQSPLGQWAKSQVGIGPVLAAGCMAHIDITKAPTTGHIWSFAGIDTPANVWNKGEKRPWNADLKVICWKMGESFVKVSGNPEAYYGQLYKRRKEYEVRRNVKVKEIPKGAVEPIPGMGTAMGYKVDGEWISCYNIGGKWYAGGNAKWAAKALEKRIGKDTDAYKFYSVGKLPPAHVHARAKRWTVKMFLSHYHDVGYRLIYNEEPPLPYAIEHLGHVHYMPPPEGKAA